MKAFEWFYVCVQPVYLPLYRRVRRELIRISRQFDEPREFLDVGGRKSHYTIGVPANITITDLPRETDIQHRLGLGINASIIERTKERRTNVRAVLIDDMTNCSLPSNSFDCVVAVEVLEHVEQDADFVSNVQRVLKPGGVFLMTTPNGDYLKIPNPDHKRHYSRRELADLLSRYFPETRVDYAIKGGLFRRWGLQSWSFGRPIRTMQSMIGNVVNSVESARNNIRLLAKGTHHLVAFARKLPPSTGSPAAHNGEANRNRRSPL